MKPHGRPRVHHVDVVLRARLFRVAQDEAARRELPVGELLTETRRALVAEPGAEWRVSARADRAECGTRYSLAPAPVIAERRAWIVEANEFKAKLEAESRLRASQLARLGRGLGRRRMADPVQLDLWGTRSRDSHEHVHVKHMAPMGAGLPGGAPVM